MSKTLTTLTILIATACAAAAKPANVTWTKTSGPVTVTYQSGDISGDFIAKLKHEGKSILKKDQSFSISITTTADATTRHKGFANEYGVGLLATGDPYAEPNSKDANKQDNEFGLYIGSGKSVPLNGRMLDQRKAELHFNNQVYKAKNYAINHGFDGDRDTLTLSYTLTYTAEDAVNTPRMLLTANKGSDVTFDSIMIDKPATAVLFETLQNGGMVTSPVGTKTNITISVPSEAAPMTLTHVLLAALGGVVLASLLLRMGSRRRN